ncbi:MAG: TSUP family transporter [Huintestinicola sp.]
MKKKTQLLTAGAVSGFINGFFGSGGGIAAVELLKKTGYETKKAHAASLTVTLPVSAVSAVFYLMKSSTDISGVLPLILPGIAGAAVGAACIKKIPSLWLSRLFGILLLAAGIRSLFS